MFYEVKMVAKLSIEAGTEGGADVNTRSLVSISVLTTFTV
jgi:hypothetical protein